MTSGEGRSRTLRRVERSHAAERRRQRDNPDLSTGSNHRPSAYGCAQWTGDRAPLDMGKCPTCEPPLKPEDLTWLSHVRALAGLLDPSAHARSQTLSSD